jgi:hypothetical protein
MRDLFGTLRSRDRDILVWPRRRARKALDADGEIVGNARWAACRGQQRSPRCRWIVGRA